MNKYILLSLISFLFLVSCSKKVAPLNSIPLRYNGHLYLDVKVQDKVYGNFIFDTGVYGICVDSLFFQENGLGTSAKDIKIQGIGNSTSTGQVITDTIDFEFANNEYRYATLTIMYDFKGLLGKSVDGISGLNTFEQKPYMLDYVSQKIIFTDSVKGYKPIAAEFKDNRIYIPLTITLKNKKKIKGKFLLDTGCTQTVLNSHVYMTDGIYNATDKKEVLAKGGFGGDTNGCFLPLKGVELGDFKIKNIIATVSKDSLGMLASPDYMGIIGNDLLDDFNIIFDHQKEKIWIKPNKNFNKNDNKLFRAISFLDKGEYWIVSGMVTDTEPYTKGIRMNDQILQVNNIPVKNINLDEFLDSLKVNDDLLLKIKQENEVKDIKFKLKVFIRS
ncbi:hypothetical protein GN157_04670 [Flavobacterium rakeshii]|uniref:PDZ domain-containing protein n=1 Tax=Flavobacterium rakeshii TaxID=1038845 RepID=A0A6N8HBR3_9FLAO|nr:aspartyl protease family protein [Flavobacterium rakeshii]MUV02995.1 hypothetical protein [Flavobacterium rakeshii]